MLSPASFYLLSFSSRSRAYQFRELLNGFVVRRLRRALLCTFILVLAGLPAWASPGRIVLANGKLHQIGFGCGVAAYCKTGNLQYRRGLPQAVNGVFVSDGTAMQPTPYKVCKTWIPPIYAYLEPSPVGESVAVFNNQIYHAFTADTDCNDHNKGMSAFVARFDLRSTPDFPNGHWLPELKELGSVHTDNAGRGAGSGAAITVFDNKLYVFTDSGTYTSLDGTGWTPYGPLYTNSNEQPLDAVTINPPNGQRILVVYGYMSGQHTYYDRLEAVDWNGQFGIASNPIHYNGFFNIHVAGRVSLSAGTKAAAWGLAAGAKQAAVQLFAQTDTDAVRHSEYTYTDAGGTWTTDSAALTYLYPEGPSLTVYPWSVSFCDKTYPKQQAQKQRIVVFGDGTAGYSFDSDNLVPQNTDQIKDCTTPPAGTGTATNDPGPTGDPLDIRKHYWSLIGVVLGPAPFSDQGLAEETYPDYAALHDLSKVSYFQSSATKIETEHEMTNELMFSLGSDMKAGLFDEFAISKNFDATYKHAWENAYGTKSTEKMEVTQTVGTIAEGKDDLGHHGWAVFSAPIVNVQNWKVYAYDYNYHTGAGTPLGMSLQTISSLGGSTIMWELFDLADPASTDPLLAGMKEFGYSRDLAFWAAPKDPNNPNDVWNWQQDGRWETRFGNGTTGDKQVQVLQYGSVNDVAYELENETMNSSGETNQIDIQGGANIEDGLLLGFPLDLKAGYTGIFKWKVTNTTESGTKVTANYIIPTCLEGPHCVDALLVQPYWLKALDSANRAPWVPDAYATQQPWCLTWKVLRYHYKGTTAFPGTTGGIALPPLNASGRIVSGTGDGDQRGDPYSHYLIQGGRMAWADAQGNEQKIPMTADEFVPSKGVTVEVNGRSWSLSGNNLWNRNGAVWTFQSPGNVHKNRVLLRLDFASATYDLQVRSADFDGVPAGVRNTQLVLTINQRYKFYTDLKHDTDIAWRWRKSPTDNSTMHVTSFEGHYNSANQSGKMSMAGTLPNDLSTFGDVSMMINGDERIFPLIAMDNFQQALANGGVLRYAKEGLILVVDFGKKTWSVTFNNKAFSSFLAPHWGKFRARILVGGVPWYQAENAVLDYSANLTLSK